jgi:hypothetical protein
MTLSTGPKREEVAGGSIKLHNDSLHDLYSSQNIIRVIKSRRMRWTGRASRMAEENLNGIDHIKNVGVWGREDVS